MDKCPLCGGWIYPHQHPPFHDLRDDPGYRTKHEIGGENCVIRQLATAQAENERLRAIIEGCRDLDYWIVEEAEKHLLAAQAAEETKHGQET